MTSPRAPMGRPPASSPAAVEEVAFELLLRDGYAATTVESICAAAGVGRTTLFRYFGSKAGIVWGEFDRAVERLRSALADTAAVPAMEAVRTAVVTSTRQSRDAAPETWLDRFRVLDRDPALVAEGAAHWKIWADTVSGYIVDRARLSRGSPLAASIGGAVQAGYVAVLRSWALNDASAEVDVDELHRALTPIVDAFQTVLDRA